MNGRQKRDPPSVGRVVGIARQDPPIGGQETRNRVYVVNPKGTRVPDAAEINRMPNKIREMHHSRQYSDRSTTQPMNRGHHLQAFERKKNDKRLLDEKQRIDAQSHKKTSQSEPGKLSCRRRKHTAAYVVERDRRREIARRQQMERKRKHKSDTFQHVMTSIPAVDDGNDDQDEFVYIRLPKSALNLGDSSSSSSSSSSPNKQSRRGAGQKSGYLESVNHKNEVSYQTHGGGICDGGFQTLRKVPRQNPVDKARPISVAGDGRSFGYTGSGRAEQQYSHRRQSQHVRDYFHHYNTRNLADAISENNSNDVLDGVADFEDSALCDDDDDVDDDDDATRDLPELLDKVQTLREKQQCIKQKKMVKGAKKMSQVLDQEEQQQKQLEGNEFEQWEESGLDTIQPSPSFYQRLEDLEHEILASKRDQPTESFIQRLEELESEYEIGGHVSDKHKHGKQTIGPRSLRNRVQHLERGVVASKYSQRNRAPSFSERLDTLEQSFSKLQRLSSQQSSAMGTTRRQAPSKAAPITSKQSSSASNDVFNVGGMQREFVRTLKVQDSADEAEVENVYENPFLIRSSSMGESNNEGEEESLTQYCTKGLRSELANVVSTYNNKNVLQGETMSEIGRLREKLLKNVTQKEALIREKWLPYQNKQRRTLSGMNEDMSEVAASLACSTRRRPVVDKYSFLPGEPSISSGRNVSIPYPSSLNSRLGSEISSPWELETAVGRNGRSRLSGKLLTTGNDQRTTASKDLTQKADPAMIDSSIKMLESLEKAFKKKKAEKQARKERDKWELGNARRLKPDKSGKKASE